MRTEQIEELVRAQRPDLQLHGIEISRVYPLPGTAWDTDNGLVLWHVRVKTIDQITNRTQLLTATHEGEGSTLADAISSALVKLKSYDLVARTNRLRTPLVPWFHDKNIEEPPLFDGEMTDDPDPILRKIAQELGGDSAAEDPRAWVRDEVARRAKEARNAK